MVPYATWPECDCLVHKGYDDSINKIEDQMLPEVTRLMEKYPTYSVKTTGHSLGAAQAQFAALKLLKAGIPVTSINFGSPRIGGDDFAVWAASMFPDNYRVNNHKEFAPHYPASFMGFHHFGTEIYLEPGVEARQCDASGEDPSCSMKWKNRPYEWSF